MHAEASTHSASGVARDHDVAGAAGVGHQPPQERCAAVTGRGTPVRKNRSFIVSATTHGKHGRQEPALRRQRHVTDRVDASMHTMKTARGHSSPDRGFGEPSAAQLVNRYDAVLPGRDLGDSQIDLGDFPLHCGG